MTRSGNRVSRGEDPVAHCSMLRNIANDGRQKLISTTTGLPRFILADERYLNEAHYAHQNNRILRDDMLYGNGSFTKTCAYRATALVMRTRYQEGGFRFGQVQWKRKSGSDDV